MDNDKCHTDIDLIVAKKYAYEKGYEIGFSAGKSALLKSIPDFLHDRVVEALEYETKTKRRSTA